MKKNLVTAVLMTIATTILFGIIYPFAVTALAQLLFPKQANGQLIRRGDQVIGSRLIGQPFTWARYFHPRPRLPAMAMTPRILADQTWDQPIRSCLTG